MTWDEAIVACERLTQGDYAADGWDGFDTPAVGRAATNLLAHLRRAREAGAEPPAGVVPGVNGGVFAEWPHGELEVDAWGKREWRPYGAAASSDGGAAACVAATLASALASSFAMSEIALSTCARSQE
jgi:hypothetical protein